MDHHLIAFEHDGTVKWVGPDVTSVPGNALSLYDLEGEGHITILTGYQAFDSTGKLLWTGGHTSAATAADLDGDGKLEVISATPRFTRRDALWRFRRCLRAQPHVANLDDDPEPECSSRT